MVVSFPSKSLPLALGADHPSRSRRQWWSTYAVHLTTLMPPAIIGDALLWFFLWKGVSDWPAEQIQLAICAFAAWMIFSKFIKLITHFVRYPVDILLWPVSVLFGWVHGAIKVYAAITLSEVSYLYVSASWAQLTPSTDHLGQSGQCRCQRLWQNDQAKENSRPL